jgi:hypothetical protein
MLVRPSCGARARNQAVLRARRQSALADMDGFAMRMTTLPSTISCAHANHAQGRARGWPRTSLLQPSADIANVLHRGSVEALGTPWSNNLLESIA